MEGERIGGEGMDFLEVGCDKINEDLRREKYVKLLRMLNICRESLRSRKQSVAMTVCSLRLSWG